MNYLIIALLYIFFIGIAVALISATISLWIYLFKELIWDDIFMFIANFALALVLTAAIILAGIYLVITGLAFHPSMWF